MSKKKRKPTNESTDELNEATEDTDNVNEEPTVDQEVKNSEKPKPYKISISTEFTTLVSLRLLC